MDDVAFALEDGSAVITDALAVLVGGALRTLSLAHAPVQPVARLAQTSVAVAVVVLAGVAVGADAPDLDILGLADTSASSLGPVLVDARTGDPLAGLLVLVVSLTSQTLGADALHDVVARSTVALPRVEVVDLVGPASDPTHPVVDVVGLALGTLRAEVVDQVEPRLADTPADDEVLVGRTNRSADPVTSLAAPLGVPLNAVAAADPVVEDLSPGVALTADVVDQVVPRQTSAGPDNGVPDLVVGTGSMADPVGGVVDFSRGTDTAAVPDQVVALLADTLAVHVVLVGIAGGSAQTQTLDVAGLAVALLGVSVVDRVHHAGVARPVGHPVVLRQADAGLLADVEDFLVAAGHPAQSQSLVVDLVPGALSTDPFDGVVSHFAAAAAVLQDLIDSAADNAVASAVLPIAIFADTNSLHRVEGGLSLALSAHSVDLEVSLGAVALSSDDVVDLIGQTGDSADAQVGVVEGVCCALLANAVDQVVARLADALPVHLEGVDVLAEPRRVGERSRHVRLVGVRDALAAVEDIPLDTVTFLIKLVVDSIGWANSTLSVDQLEASNADTLQTSKVQVGIRAALGPADAHCRLVVVGGSTVGANTSDQVEVLPALADVVDEHLVDAADGNRNGRRHGRRDVDFEALSPANAQLSGLELVALDAVAGAGPGVVGGVGGTDVADGFDAAEAIVADAPLIPVDFVPAADGVVRVEGEALAVAHVVADETNALAEDVIVHLVDGAGDLLRLGISRGGHVGTVGHKGVGDLLGSVAQVIGGLGPRAHDCLVGLRADGENILPRVAGLRVEQDKQEGQDDCLY